MTSWRELHHLLHVTSSSLASAPTLFWGGCTHARGHGSGVTGGDGLTGESHGGGAGFTEIKGQMGSYTDAKICGY